MRLLRRTIAGCRDMRARSDFSELRIFISLNSIGPSSRTRRSKPSACDASHKTLATAHDNGKTDAMPVCIRIFLARIASAHLQLLVPLKALTAQAARELHAWKMAPPPCSQGNIITRISTLALITAEALALAACGNTTEQRIGGAAVGALGTGGAAVAGRSGRWLQCRRRRHTGPFCGQTRRPPRHPLRSQDRPATITEQTQVSALSSNVLIRHPILVGCPILLTRLHAAVLEARTRDPSSSRTAKLFADGMPGKMAKTGGGGSGRASASKRCRAIAKRLCWKAAPT